MMLRLGMASKRNGRLPLFFWSWGSPFSAALLTCNVVKRRTRSARYIDENLRSNRCANDTAKFSVTNKINSYNRANDGKNRIFGTKKVTGPVITSGSG